MLMMRITFLLLMCSACGFAQLDSLALRAKLGSPLHRETFHVAAGFDVIVDYASGGRVCRLEVPALMPTKDSPKVNADVMRQRMYDFLAEIVPMSVRGLEKEGWLQSTGGNSLTSKEYENVTVSEIMAHDPFGKEHTITVTFKNEPCDRLEKLLRHPLPPRPVMPGPIAPYIQQVRDSLRVQDSRHAQVLLQANVGLARSQHDFHAPAAIQKPRVSQIRHEIRRTVVVAVFVVIPVQKLMDVERSAHAHAAFRQIRMLHGEVHRMITAEAAPGDGYIGDALRERTNGTTSSTRYRS